jgi:replicative DNA helicase
MSAEQYLLRMLARGIDCPTWAIAEGKLFDNQYPKYVHELSHIHSKNLFIYDDLYKYSEIEQTTRMLKEKKNISIIIIDYLQNMWAPGRTIYERMSPLAPQLFFLARSLGITVIALSQVDNASVRDGGSKIIGYKGAGEIAAAADLCIELERYKEVMKKDWLKFTIRKNRHGKVGTGNFKYADHYRRLEEMPQDED